jgi:hypothetical protein
VASLFKNPKKWFKSAKKKLKQTVKGAAKIVSKAAPIAAIIPGVGTAVAAIAGGIGSKLSQALGKGGKFAQSAANKLGQVKEVLDSGKTGAPKPVNEEPLLENSSNLEQPFAMSDKSPAMASVEPPQRAGMDPKMLLIAGGALLGIILLTRKR